MLGDDDHQLPTWQNLRRALGQLEPLIRCPICNHVEFEPKSVAICDHHFCGECIENALALKSACPICALPAWQNELRKNTQIAAVVQSYRNLRALAYGEPREDTSSVRPQQAQRPAQKDTFTKPRRPSAAATASRSGSAASGCTRSRGQKRRSGGGGAGEEEGREREKREASSASVASTSTTAAKTKSASGEKGRARTRGPSTAAAKASATTATTTTTTTPAAGRRRPETPESAGTSRQTAMAKTSPASITTKKNTTPRNAKGETPLHRAAIKGDLAATQALLQQLFCDVNAKDNAGWTPLHEACNHNHAPVVEALLQAGADVNVPGYMNETPLHDAINNDRIEIALLLLKYGANRHSVNRYGLTPFEVACSEAMRDALQEFVRTNADTQMANSQYVDRAPPRATETQDVVILASGLDTQQKEHLEKWAKALSAIVVTKCQDDVTHIVTKASSDRLAKRTIKYLWGVLQGKWVVSYDWLKACMREGEWVSEDPYEIRGDMTALNGPMKGRRNVMAQLPGLFEGCNFFFRGDFVGHGDPPKAELVRMAGAGGGNMLTREPKPQHTELSNMPYHLGTSLGPVEGNDDTATAVDPRQRYANAYTHYIVCDEASASPVIRQPPVCTVPVQWLFDCVSSFAILPPPDVDS